MVRYLNRLQPWALCFIRVFTGAVLLVASWDKVYPATGLLHGHLLVPEQHFNQFVATLGLPSWLGYVSTFTEFVGGLFLVFGLLTRFWGLMIAGNMIVAVITVNRHHGWAGSQFSLALIAMSFLLLTAGSGKLALDRRLGLCYSMVWDENEKLFAKEVKAPGIQGALHRGGDLAVRIGEAGTEGTESPAGYNL